MYLFMSILTKTSAIHSSLCPVSNWLFQRSLKDNQIHQVLRKMKLSLTHCLTSLKIFSWIWKVQIEPWIQSKNTNVLLQALAVIRNIDLKQIHEFSRNSRVLHTFSMSVLILEYESKRTKTVSRTFSTSLTHWVVWIMLCNHCERGRHCPFKILQNRLRSKVERFLWEARAENHEMDEQNDVQKL